MRNILSKIKSKIKNYLFYFLSHRDVIFELQTYSESKFFRIDPKKISKILGENKIEIFDVGAAGGLEKMTGFNKYKKNCNLTFVEPREDDSIEVFDDNSIRISKLIGRENGDGSLNITEHETKSSMLNPSGSYLHYFFSNQDGFRVKKTLSFEVTNIETVLKETKKNIDFLKLDTQGNELDILLGMGDCRPLFIQTEISFVPLYENSSIYFELANYLYKIGYVLFAQSYVSGSTSKNKKKLKWTKSNTIPVHGDAWFMPDYTREEGKKIIYNRKKQYEALMLIYAMRDIANEALNEI